MTAVFETRDVGLLRGLLESDRVAGAYLIGDLDAPFFEQGRWLVAAENGAAVALVLVFEALAEPVILSFGRLDGVQAIVGCAGAARPGSFPSACYLKVPPEHEAAFARVFEIVERDVMKVMALDACVGPVRAARVEAPRFARDYDVRPLTPAFPIEQILDVYRSYPGHFFEPAQLTAGTYFGSFDGERLVGVAGTHVCSPAGRIAAVGNIVTAEDARGRGHAAACTRAVIDALHERGCDTIVLHVAESNAPALACYRRLGFKEYAEILQLKGRLHAQA